MKRKLPGISILPLVIVTVSLFFFNLPGRAQVSNYVFTQSSGTYNSIYSLGRTTGVSGTATSSIKEIDYPFFFYVNGIQYYLTTVTSNGFVTLGATDPSTALASPISATTGYDVAISALGMDLQGQGSPPVFYMSGLPPYRTCTIEYKNFRRSGGSGDNINFQIKLYESTNVIQIVYGTVFINTGTNTPAQVGLRGAANTDFENRTGSNWASSSAGGANTNTMDLKNTVAPASGLTFTFTPPSCSAPATAIAAPTLSSITSSGLSGSFTGNGSTGYLVVRTETSTAPAVINTNNYPAGTFAAGGYIESNGTATAWTSTGLAAGKQYWFWVYPYTATAACSKMPKYNTGSSSATATTTATCAFSGVNNLSLTGSTNWSSASWSAGHVPTPCETVTITYTGTGSASLTLDVNASVKNLTVINASPSSSARDFSFGGSQSLIVDGNFVISGAGAANRYSRMQFNVTGRTLINGTTTIGTATFGDALATIGSNGSKPEQTFVFKGDVTFLRKGLTIDEHAMFVFDGAGTQNLINNSSADSATDPILFETLLIGDKNTTTLNCSGTWPLMDVNDKNRGGVTINTNCGLILPANISLNGQVVGGSWFWMKSGSSMKLGGGFSQSINYYGGVKDPAITNPVGSNFPIYFSNYIFESGSVIEYNGGNSITQTIYDTTSYQKLIITNGSGSGRAAKNTIRPIQVNETTVINAGADVTLGAGWTNAQSLNVVTDGGLYCAANVVDGAGAFTLNDFSYLGMGHAQGITPGTAAVGNIQMMGGRSYSNKGNYIYNGNVNQVTNTGLPTTCNDLTIDNTATNGTVTIATNQLVNGTNLLKTGTFVIDNTKLNIAGTLNSTGGKMKANIAVLELNNASASSAQALSGGWFVNKTISTLVNSHKKGITVAASPADTLLIAKSLLYGTGTTNSAITTNDNLTLLSRDTGTANFGEIVTGSGNSITGKVNVERYLYAKKSWRFLATPVVVATSPTVTAAWRENGITTSTGYGTQMTGPTGTTGMDQTSVGYSFKSFSSVTDAWVGVINTAATLANNTGYMVFVRGDRSVNGTGTTGSTNLRIKGDIRTGNQVFSVTAGKYQSIGNPYPSRVDMRTITKSNIANAFTIWNPNSAGMYNVGAYETYTYDGTNYRKTPGGTIRNYVESGEAVFVQSNSASAGSVTVKESDKTSGASLVSRQAMTGGEEEEGGTTASRWATGEPTIELNLYAVNPDNSFYLTDGVMQNFNPSYSPQVDNMDVRKSMNTADNVAMINSNYNLIVERRPAPVPNDTIQLSLTGIRVTKYRFEVIPTNINTAGLEAFIDDNYLGTHTPLSLTDPTNIDFTVEAVPGSWAADRFRIVFRSPVGVLPVTFVSIAAKRNIDKTVTVKWNTENELNMQGYEIQQSNDGSSFRSIGTQSPTATNGGSAAYTFIDNNATAGNNYYRIKGTSINGRVQYTAIVKVGPLNEATSLSIYPNPVTDGTVNLRFANQPKGEYNVQITNKLGQVIHTEKLQVQNGNMVRSIELGKNAAAGTYQVTVTGSEGKPNTVPFLIR